QHPGPPDAAAWRGAGTAEAGTAEAGTAEAGAAESREDRTPGAGRRARTAGGRTGVVRQGPPGGRRPHTEEPAPGQTPARVLKRCAVRRDALTTERASLHRRSRRRRR